MTATDYFGHHMKVFSEGDLRPALAASAAHSGGILPVVHRRTHLIDGGMYNPVPFDLLRGKADIVIAVDVVGAPQEVDGQKADLDRSDVRRYAIADAVDHRAQDGALRAGHPAAAAGIQIPGRSTS